MPWLWRTIKSAGHWDSSREWILLGLKVIVRWLLNFFMKNVELGFRMDNRQNCGHAGQFVSAPNRIGRLLLPWLMVSLMVIVGCATTPPPTTASPPATPPWPSPPPTGFATVLVYTTSRALGSGPEVYVDDVQAFKLYWHSYTWVYVRAGDHMIRTKWGIGLGGLNATGNVNLAAGKGYYLKLSESDDYFFGADQERVSESLRTVSADVAIKETLLCDFRPPLVLQIDTAQKVQPAGMPTSTPSPGALPGPTVGTVPVTQNLGADF